MKKYKGFVYEWTNTITGKKYIGSHVGDETDGYIGSGVDFKRDLQLHGLNSFTRVILEYVEHESDIPYIEKRYLEKVNAKDNPDYYNKTYCTSKRKTVKKTQKRKLCAECNSNLQAINYVDPNGIRHYRKLCSSCLRKKRRLRPQAPLWYKHGYRKKPQCEKCGFKLNYVEQSVVYFIDGNLQNINWYNLKTVCLNCQQELLHSSVGWRAGPIVPDF